MTHALRAHAAALLLIPIAAACAVSNVPVPPPAREIATLHRHLQEFATDDNPIDDPGSPGERRAIKYAADYFESLKLKTTIQSVPLVRMVPTAATVQVHGPKGQVITADSSGQDFIVWPGQQGEQVSLDAPVIFAGYGIVAPEYDRDDFKSIDVKGKIVLVLEGSPHTGQSDDLGSLGETYYGTRYYKFAEAARHGAAAVLIIHGGLGAPWQDIQEEDTGSVISIDTPIAETRQAPKAKIEGWLSGPAAEKLFTFAAVDYVSMYQMARELGFEPMPIPGISVTFNLVGRTDRATSQDVIAVLPGQTPEYLIVAGRWNRIDPAAWAHTLKTERLSLPDDDGSGAAMVMETAAQLVRQGRRPLRTIVFMVTTALKPGIVGLQYYIDHPVAELPITNLAALLFLDRADPNGVSLRVGKIGEDSDGALSQITREAAIEQGRLVEVDETPEKRFYYRFGQTALAQQGVRVIYLTTKGEEGRTRQALQRVAQHDDVVGLDVTHPAASTTVGYPTRDADLLAAITSRVANATNWPPRVLPEPASRR